MPHETLKNLTPRKYQQDIYNNCKNKNCLVVLPTGVGKTLIALMLAIHRQKAVPGTKTLFLAPTRPLAEQHLEYFKKNLPELFAEQTLFTGKTQAQKRKELWQTSDIVFSTPQCISNDLKNNLYTLEDVSLLIEDECHRCLKNYAYTFIARAYKEQAKNPHILGLTASPGTTKEIITEIATTLGIESIELRTRDSDDVKEYLQELEFNAIRLEYPEEFKQVSNIIRSIYDKRVEELKKRKLLFKPANKMTLLEAQGTIMMAIRNGNKNFNFLVGSSVCAQALKLAHLIELLETQTLFTAQNYIKNLFEQTKQNQSKAVIRITKNKEFNYAYIQLNQLIAKNLEHPKLLELKEIIQDSINENPKNKTIVFSQYRDTTTKIAEELNKIKGIKAKTFVGQNKKQGSGLSQKEQKEIMDEFREGSINIIAATSIAEEGLDIPEVNSVIFYEPIPSAIRQIQRRGRTARLMKGKLVILITNDTLDEIFYYSSRAKEKRMHNAIASIQKDLESGKPLKQKPKQETLFG
ncbi:DEAD/DEAH box helicase [archaeon]|jgi:ERCC4-related helicase|nr:DEAD/DEAH box helicase [archaeon]